MCGLTPGSQGVSSVFVFFRLETPRAQDRASTKDLPVDPSLMSTRGSARAGHWAGRSVTGQLNNCTERRGFHFPTVLTTKMGVCTHLLFHPVSTSPIPPACFCLLDCKMEPKVLIGRINIRLLRVIWDTVLAQTWLLIAHEHFVFCVLELRKRVLRVSYHHKEQCIELVPL